LSWTKKRGKRPARAERAESSVLRLLAPRIPAYAGRTQWAMVARRNSRASGLASVRLGKASEFFELVADESAGHIH